MSAYFLQREHNEYSLSVGNSIQTYTISIMSPISDVSNPGKIMIIKHKKNSITVSGIIANCAQFMTLIRLNVSKYIYPHDIFAGRLPRIILIIAVVAIAAFPTIVMIIKTNPATFGLPIRIA